jgi:two-component system, chemotaxis family, chemotaxis protein CheY
MKLEGIVDMTRCLLIDEDGLECHRLLELLDGLGVDTAQTAKSDEALRYCNDNAPDVVMLAAAGSDARPKDFVRRLRRNIHGKKPVVFLYAETPDTDMIGQSILQGAADVLMHPFDRDILQFKLRQAGVIA